MASDKQTVAHLVAQLGAAGAIRSRPMFGEVGIYCDDVFVAMICDDQLYVKASAIAPGYLGDEHLAPPYPGAKDAYRVPAERWDDPVWLSDFVRATTSELAKKSATTRSRSTRRGSASGDDGNASPE